LFIVPRCTVVALVAAVLLLTPSPACELNESAFPAHPTSDGLAGAQKIAVVMEQTANDSMLNFLCAGSQPIQSCR